MNPVKEARKGAGLTQEALARKAGITTSTVQKVEAGRFQPRLGTARRIAHALGLTLGELFEDPAA